jgi:hypothetical protein
VPNAYFDLPLLAVRSRVPLPSLLARLPALERGRCVVRLHDGAAPAERSYIIAPAGLRAVARPLPPAVANR